MERPDRDVVGGRVTEIIPIPNEDVPRAGERSFRIPRHQNFSAGQGWQTPQPRLDNIGPVVASEGHAEPLFLGALRTRGQCDLIGS